MANIKIEVPAPVNVKLGDSTRVIAFWDFMRENVLADPSFGKTWDDVLSAASIRDALKKLEEDYAAWILAAADGKNPEPLTLELDERDFDKVYASAKAPQGGYNPVVAVQIIDFIRAIKNAKK